MAKITRKNQKIFASTPGLDQIGVFGSLAAGSIAYSDDPDVIQSLANFVDGWFDAVVGFNSPAIEDLNALDYLWSYQLAYIFQSGIPEWNDATTYYQNSYCQGSDGVLYQSLVDNNTNHNPTSDATRWNTGFQVPVGGIIDYAKDAVPAGFLACDGSAFSRTDYANLFGVIGTVWGSGDGSTTFNVPDLRGRVTVGAGVTYAGQIGPDVGDIGGEATHTLIIAEMPAHAHPGTTFATASHQHAQTLVREVGTDFAMSGSVFGQTTGPGTTQPGGTGFTIGQQAGSVNIQNTTFAMTSQPVNGTSGVDTQGGDGAHNNIQPTAVVIKIIKY